MQKNVTNRMLRAWLSVIMIATLCVIARAHDDDKKWIVRKSAQSVSMARGDNQNDTVLRRTTIELPAPALRMTQSVHPVMIRQVGATLCVKSEYTQMLPIYTEGKRFYASFRLNKGTNWLSGLPRGTYFINNRKITIL